MAAVNFLLFDITIICKPNFPTLSLKPHTNQAYSCEKLGEGSLGKNILLGSRRRIDGIYCRRDTPIEITHYVTLPKTYDTPAVFCKPGTYCSITAHILS